MMVIDGHHQATCKRICFEFPDYFFIELGQIKLILRSRNALIIISQVIDNDTRFLVQNDVKSK